MTTIAYKDGIIATDSYCTQGVVIADNEFVKRHIYDKVHFFTAGSVSNIPIVVAGYFTKAVDPSDIEKANSVSLYVWDKGEDFLGEIGFDDDGELWSHSIVGTRTGIGSGAAFAIGAMDAGSTAKDAVKIASERDVFTGGKIRTYRVG